MKSFSFAKNAAEVLPNLYLLGRAFSALGRKEEALLVWEQGYDHAVCQSADLKQLLELEDLLKTAKQNGSIPSQNGMTESSELSSRACGSAVSESSEISDNHVKSNGKSKPSNKSGKQFEVHDKLQNGLSPDGQRDSSLRSQLKQKDEIHPTETKMMHNKLAEKSVLTDSSALGTGSSVVSSESSEFPDICSESFSLSDIQNELMDEANRSKKFCVARISKNKSINVDFRLSRGIAQVRF